MSVVCVVVLLGFPGQGDAETVSRLFGKHIVVGAKGTASAKPQVDAGKFRPLLSFEPAGDFGLAPSVPDLLGVYGKDFSDIEVSVYLFVPTKTPGYIVQTQEKTFEQMGKSPEFAADYAKNNRKSSFIPGKIVMEKAKKKMELVKVILADQKK